MTRALRRRYGRRAGRTVLDRLLDRVEAGVREVTFDTEGYRPEQVRRVTETATARGLSASYDGRFVLVRDLRKTAEGPYGHARKRGAKRSRYAHARRGGAEKFEREVEALLVRYGVTPGLAAVWVQNHGGLIRDRWEAKVTPGAVAERILKFERDESAIPWRPK